MKNIVWKILIIAAFFILIIFHLNDFVFLSNSDFSDIPITHYPNLLYIQRSLIEYGQVPLWTNQIYSGMPFAANPLSGLWYIPGWIALLFPLPFGINLTLLLHLFFGLWGLMNFLLLKGRSPAAALFGSLSFFAGVKIMSHFGAGHLTFIYAICWTPWLLYLTERTKNEKNWVKYILPGISLGLIISADPRWVVPAGLIWAFYVFTTNYQIIPSPKHSLVESVKLLTSNTVIALGLSAAVWLPLFEFVSYSSRATMSVKDNLNYSLNFEKLFGLIFPDFGGFSEWIVYPSMLVLFLSVLVLFLYKENKKERIWFWLILISLFLSLGDALPFTSFLFRLPLINLLRVPARFFFVSLFSMSILTSFGFDYLVSKNRSYQFDRLFFLTPLLSFIVIFFAGFGFITQAVKLNLLWALLFSVSAFLVIGLAIHKKLSGKLLIIFLFIILFFDISGVNYLSLGFRSKKELISGNPKIALNLKLDTPYRIYSPSYAITQEEAAYWGLHQVHGIDPMQLRSYVNYFTVASGVPDMGYSVTLPAFTNGEPNRVNQPYCPDVKLLEKLSVKYIISDFSMDDCNSLNFEEEKDSQFINEITPEWAWVSTFDGEKTVNIEKIELIMYSPNRIKFNIQQQGVLTISELYYPGWKVFVNGEEQVIMQDGIFRSINLHDPYNKIEMIFRPIPVFVGLGIEVITWSLIVIYLIRKKK